MVTSYEKIKKELHPAWKHLKHHRYQNTVGVDDVSINSFKKDERKNLRNIRARLSTKDYKFGTLRASYKKKKDSDDKRRLLIGTVADRIVSKAILNIVARPFAKIYPSTINYCPLLREKNEKQKEKQKDIHKAVAVIKEGYKNSYIWAFETDIANFFESLDKNKMKLLIQPYVDKDTFALVSQIIDYKATGLDAKDVISEEYGVAQGSSLSPLFANIYLNEFDKVIAQINDVIVVRYVDDLVVLCKTKQKAETVKNTVINALKVQSLTYKKEKTDIVNLGIKPLKFLGVQFTASHVSIPTKKKDELAAKLKAVPEDKKAFSLIKKMNKLQTLLKAYIKYYKFLDVRDFDVQLTSLVTNGESIMTEYVDKSLKKILDRDIFEGLTDEKKQEFAVFLGLRFASLRELIQK